MLTALAMSAGAAASAPGVAAAADPPPPMEFELADRTGDDVGPIGTDIVAATVTQDRAAGVIKASIDFASDPSSARALIHVGFGFLQYGRCETIGQGGIGHLISVMNELTATYRLSARSEVGGNATKVTQGNTVTITSDPDPGLLSATIWSCTRVEVYAVDENGHEILDTIYDEVVGLKAKAAPTPTPTPVAPPAVNGQAVVLDADRDAVPDSTDQCKDVPGAGTNGCPTTPDAKSLKLGAKRIVIDRLLSRTGKACPAVVKVTVAAKGRTLGKKKLGVVAHGAYCQVVGKVILKKRVTKVRVVIAGADVQTVKTVVSR